MKRYEGLSALLIDYRELNDISQAEFADSLGVDVRSVQRWEREETIVKPEKEEDIVVETMLPYQLIRNLNASVPIPTFYDFSIRKYSLTELSNELPKTDWFKIQFENSTDNIRGIDFDLDISYLQRYLDFRKNVSKNLVATIKEAIRLLPELNLIITDDSGYYSGHGIVFPLKETTFERLKNREILEEDLTVDDLVDNANKENPIFYNYDLTADCNTNIYYLMNRVLHYFYDFPTDYLLGSCAIRYDTYHLNEQLGLNMIWEEPIAHKKHNFDTTRRFYVGDFKAFLADV